MKYTIEIDVEADEVLTKDAIDEAVRFLGSGEQGEKGRVTAIRVVPLEQAGDGGSNE